AILHPFVKVFGGQAAQIGRDVSSGARQLAEAHELIRAEPVRLVLLRSAVEFLVRVAASGAAIIAPEVGVAWAILARANAVAPVVTVGETAARPADDAGFDPAHVFNQFFADAADVRDFGIFADPNPVVDHAAQMLDEMAVNIR